MFEINISKFVTDFMMNIYVYAYDVYTYTSNTSAKHKRIQAINLFII